MQHANNLQCFRPGNCVMQAAAKFRQFWGEKAELRRFQDGNIAEAVVWDVGPAERHTVVDK